jgi:hypothetical protein
MTVPPAPRRHHLVVRTLLTAVLMCGDAGLVAVVSVIWRAQARG